MKVIVLGATGMLGGMVFEYLRSLGDPNVEVVGVARQPARDFIRFDVYDDPSALTQAVGKLDYLINCVGITKPYCHDDNSAEVKNAIYINSLFPYRLAEVAKKYNFRVIQIATDCVFSGAKGNYVENDPHDALDVYGKTKSLGEVRSPSMLNIRSSIIGPERYHKAFLLEWFLGQRTGATVKGFDHHRWNGITTLQFAKLCAVVVRGNHFDELAAASHVHHFIPNTTVSKYELLQIFKQVFKKDVQIEKSSNADLVDRTLKTNYNMLSKIFPASTMDNAIFELKAFVDATKFYSVGGKL